MLTLYQLYGYHMVCGGSKVYFGNKAIVIFVSRELSWYYLWIYWLFKDYSAICTYVLSII